MTIYGRFGDPVTILRMGTLADVSITDDQLREVRMVPGIDADCAAWCELALDLRIGPGIRRDRRSKAAGAINAAMNRYADRAVAP